MLKNNELISRMSLHQRIRLITSAKSDENCPVENYEFPVFHLYSNPSLKSTDKFATFFPTDKALASTWNNEIIRNVYECTGNEAKANKEYAYFNITDCAEREAISEDGFLTSEFLKHKASGVHASGAYINFDDSPSTQNEVVLNETVKNITDGVISENKVNSLRVYSVEAAENFAKSHGFKGLLFGVASEKSEVAKYFFHGCTLVFVNEETVDGLEDYLVELTEKYEKSKEEYDNGEINITEFDRRKRSGEILDAETVNTACDNMISLLLALKERGPASVEEKATRIGRAARVPLFNEIYHDKLAYSAAQQSVVLIKNNNNVLPLAKDTPVAIIGEYAENNDYRITNKNNPTALHRPFDEITNYGNINHVGYAHGYCVNESKRLDLIETALNLCDEAKYAIVYFCAGKGATAIPTGQMELLDALARKGVKIIAVVSAERSIDLSFADKCEAVLFSYNAGQGCAQAVFDIITGEICPSGKLVDTFYKDFNSVSVEEGIPAYCTVGSSNVLYPFGYGLSFTEFDYKNLKITDAGVSCTVTNKGKFDGYCTLLMFVQRVNAHTTLANRILRGYCKVFVKKGDSVKAEILFNDDTFKVYDKNNNRLYVQGGKYEISLCNNANSVLLRGERDFKERTFEIKHESKVVATSTDGVIGFTDTELDKYIRREKKKLSFGFRLFIALVLTLYYDAMGVGLLVSNLIADKTTLLYIVIGILLFAGNLLAVIYVVIIAKRRKLQNYLHPNEVLTDMVQNVKEFDEVAKITYNQPVEKPI
ncbi:MAG: glycoside hydrolase family 3 C-terminal domain-containing protein, partial [Clostridia bacterium]|nr:glycoside hydrolase family 3 C-terminal domain-containing protein [Clostridia bacterium]